MKSPRLKTVLGVLVIVVATLVAYVPARQTGFVWDDEDYITENETRRDLAGLGRGWH